MIQLLWESIGSKIISYLISKTDKSMVQIYNGHKRRQIKKHFIDNINLELFHKYNNKSFYNELSKILIRDDVLNEIYNRCNDINVNKYSIDDDFINKLISNESVNIGIFEKAEIKEILKNILDATFSAMNEIKNSEIKKATNTLIKIKNDNDNTIIKKLESIENNGLESKKIGLENAKILKSLQDNTSLNQIQNIESFPKTILKILSNNKNKCSIELNSETKDPIFRVLLTVKYTGKISKFQTFGQYLNYLMFCGEDDILDVVEAKIYNLDKPYEYKINYDGPKYTIYPLNVYSVKYVPYFEELQHNTDTDMKLKIVPPKTIVNAAIFNENNDMIFDQRVFNIKRQKLTNGKLVITLNDTAKSKNINVTIMNIFNNADSMEKLQAFSGKINILNNNFNTVIGRLEYYKIIKKIMDSKKLIYRDRNSGELIEEVEINMPNVDLNFINNLIETFNKLIKIQDYFNVQFEVPEDFDVDSIEKIKEIYDFILYGKAEIKKYDLTIKVTKKEFNEQSKLKKDSYVSITANFNSIKLFDKTLNLKNKIIMIIPKAKILEINKDCYKFQSVDTYYYVSAQKYGNVDQLNYLNKLE